MTNKVVKKESPVLTALQTIAEQRGGVLNPRDVIEAARDEDSILHDYFEWDDSKAAEGFRLVQAGMLIRRVRLRIVAGDGGEQRTVNIQVTRAFESLPSMRSASGGYLPLRTIIDDPSKKQELLGSVLNELEAIRKKYGMLEELNEIWNVVDALIVSKDEDGAAAG